MLGPKISVIIPIYNVESYLARCLDSCLKQTLYDIEIICVDDGSTDRSAGVLELYAQADSRIRPIRLENSGVSAARNAGLRAARGQWVMFLDADDYLEDVACERVWREAQEGPTDIIVFGAYLFPQAPEPDAWYGYVFRIYTHRVNGFEPKVLFDTPCAKPFIWHKAFSAELLKRAQVWFDEHIGLGEDLTFLMEIFPQAQYFAFIPDQLYHYRWFRPNSAMQQAKRDNHARLRKHVAVAEGITRYWQSQGWLEKYKGPYVNWVVDFLFADVQKLDLTDAEREDLLGEIRKLCDEYHLAEGYRALDAHHRRLWKKTIPRGASV